MNATYVDQCDTIRTLTEEEMAVVSGGAASWQALNNKFLAEAKAFDSHPTRFYVPKGNYSANVWRNAALPVFGMFGGFSSWI